MSNTAKTNNAFEVLAEVTGFPKEQLEIIAVGEPLPDALSKYVGNLANCLESFSKQVESNDIQQKN